MLILVLEDYPLVTSDLEAVLASAGHEVLSPAATVTQALCLGRVCKRESGRKSLLRSNRIEVKESWLSH